MIVGRAHHLLPDRRAARAGAAVADRQAEAQGVAVPLLMVHTARNSVASGLAGGRNIPGGARRSGQRSRMRRHGRHETEGRNAMRLQHLVLGAALWRAGGRSALARRSGAGQHLRAAPDLPHRAVRRLRHSDRQRHERLPRRCSTSATAASAASSSPSRNARPATTPRRASSATSRSRPRSPVVVNPYSTGITLQLIPKAAVDKIPVLSMAYGLSASADGKNFPWIFNPPATYWDGLSMIIKYIGDKEGGLDKLKGKTIGYIFFDGGYGREPIPLLEQFAKDYGFTVKLYPVPAAEMQNQSGLWLNVRRDRPDWMVMWGWGAMNPTAVKEAAKINFPMDKFVGIWWSGERGRRAPGGRREPRAIWRSTSTQIGANYPGDPGHQEARRRQGQEPDPEGQGRRELLQSRRLQLGDRRRGDPQRAEDHRQEGGQRRGRAARLRDAEDHRRALEGDRPARASRRRSRACPAPTTTAITPPSCSSGTAPSG